MGMLIGFFLLIYILVSIGIYKLTKRFIKKRWVHHFVLAVIFLVPTYDIIITNILGGYHCITTPSTYISKKVEYPESIYWEDNVYPGFSEEDRKLMITNYLDGVHLKTMALNAPDGKIYVYTRDVEVQKYNELHVKSLLETKKYNQLSKELSKHNLLKEKESLWLELRDKSVEARKKMNKAGWKVSVFINKFDVSETVYKDKQSMPQMNYTVTFNEIKLNPLSSKFLYSDETKIIENRSGEVIAYNRRTKRFLYNVFLGLLGNNYYIKETIYKSNSLYYDGNGFNYIGYYGLTKHKIDLDKKLYNKYKKGKK